MTALITFPVAAVAAFALNLLFSLTAVCLMTLLAARWLFRHHPSMRYTLCLAGLISALLVPLTVGFMTKAGFNLTILSLPEYFSAPIASAAPASPLSAGNDGITAPATETPLFLQRIAVGIGAATLLWAAGVLWGILRFVRGWKIVRRFTDGIRPLEALARLEMQEASERLRGHPFPTIFTSPRVASPVVVGIFRPLIILPEGLAETLSPVQLRQILLHEYAHIAFGHTLGGVLERVARLLYWPHPLAHALCRELARAREEVCDNVASQEAGAACYARTLLALAQGMTTAPKMSSALALLGPETSLEKRIAGLLHPRRNQMTEVQRKQLWAVAGAAALVIGMTSAIRVVAAQEKTKADTLASFDKPDALWLRLTTEAKAKESARAVEVRERRTNPQPKVIHVKFQVESKGNAEPMMAQSKVQLDKEVARWKVVSKVQLDKVQLDEQVARWQVASKAQEAKIKAEAKAQEAQAAKQEAEAKPQKAQAAKQEAAAKWQETQAAKRKAEAVAQKAARAKQEAERAKTAS